MKADPTYRLDLPGDRAMADLSGLECRWQDIPSPRGHTVSLIVAALPSGGYVNEYLYGEVLETLRRIYGDRDSYHPVATANLNLSSAPQRLAAEAKARAKSSRWGDRILIHLSDRALMTCLIMDRRDRHFHLIDGADGGYALAAQRMKARLQGKRQNWRAYARLAQGRRPSLGSRLGASA